jgi:hypothetical protein
VRKREECSEYIFEQQAEISRLCRVRTLKRMVLLDTVRLCTVRCIVNRGGTAIIFALCQFILAEGVFCTLHRQRSKKLCKSTKNLSRAGLSRR